MKYIKYKNGDAHGQQTDELYSAYPSEWQTNIGLNRTMRKRRDWIVESITEDDICVEGTCAINPLIGEIPTKQEALEELESLLLEM